MSTKIVLITTVVLLMAGSALAQTPTPLPDIPREPVGAIGTYRMKMEIRTGPGQENVFEACCVRTDVDPVEELGCNPGVAGEITAWLANIPVTPGDNAEVRCYVNDPEQSSEYTGNAYTINFTFPLLPPVLQ